MVITTNYAILHKPDTVQIGDILLGHTWPEILKQKSVCYISNETVCAPNSYV